MNTPNCTLSATASSLQASLRYNDAKEQVDTCGKVNNNPGIATKGRTTAPALEKPILPLARNVISNVNSLNLNVLYVNKNNWVIQSH